MKGLIKRAILSCTAAAGAVGCWGYRDLVDPCYPQRYWHASEMEVKAAIAPQVQNGDILDRTIFSDEFELDDKNRPTDRLSMGGQAHLARLVRRRPQPDTVVFVQTVQELPPFDPANADKFTQARIDMDQKRVESIQKFLTAQASGRGLAFQVVVHDPGEVGGSAVPIQRVIPSMYGAAKGTLGGAAGAAGASAAPAGGAGAPAGGSH